ncbi:MAG: phosphatase PAP2 family protein [Actinobacteria bacterium]|nr:phosphatase PAP2 family protein [Actinomycetota bacterium]
MSRAARRLFAAAALCLLALAPLALAAYSIGPTRKLDVALLSRLGEWEDGPLFPAAHALSRLCEPGPFLALVAVLVGVGLLCGRRRQVAIAAVLLIGANLTTLVLKHLLEHQRYSPDLAFQPWADAFPSGHTTAAVSLAAAAVVIATPRLRPFAIAAGAIFSLAIGVAMMIIYAHYPSDVLGGYLVGAAWCFGTAAVVQAHRRPQARAGDRAEAPLVVSTE